MNSPSASPYGTAPAAPPLGAPTRARNIAVVFTIVLAIITYIDRVCISMAAPAIQNRPGPVGDPDGLGVLGLRLGLRVLRSARRLACRSHGTAARPHAHRRLVVVLHGGDRLGVELHLADRHARRCSGPARPALPEHDPDLHDLAAEGGARAGAGDALARARAGAARSRRCSSPTSCSSSRGGARSKSSAVLGVIWAVAFYRWFRDDPATHPSVNAAELALLPPARETAPVAGPLPWRLLLSKPRPSGCCALQYACLAYGWWFYVTWLPTYLRNSRGTSIKMGALLAGAAAADGRRRLPDLGAR